MAKCVSIRRGYTGRGVSQGLSLYLGVPSGVIQKSLSITLSNAKRVTIEEAKEVLKCQGLIPLDEFCRPLSIGDFIFELTAPPAADNVYAYQLSSVREYEDGKLLPLHRFFTKVYYRNVHDFNSAYEIGLTYNNQGNLVVAYIELGSGARGHGRYPKNTVSFTKQALRSGRFFGLSSLGRHLTMGLVKEVLGYRRQSF